MKKLTITVDEDVYEGLYAYIGRGNISSFLNEAARKLMHDAQNLNAPTPSHREFLENMAGASAVTMTTDEIMTLTRG